MVENHYDAIMIGAGHNGLVTASYLAKDGLAVLVFERHVKGGVKVYQRGGAKLYQWTRQHDWERCRGLLKLGPSLSPDLNSSCCYA